MLNRFVINNVWLTIWLSAYFCGCVLAGEQTAAADVVAAPAARPPVLDGILDDSCWSNGPAITEFVSLKAPEVKRAHQVWIAHDDTWLYLALDVRHPRPSDLTADCREHDGNLSNDDSLELFLDPGTDGKLYFHYILNAANVKAEQRAGRGGERDRPWNGPWRSATRMTDTGWTAELAIPLALPASYGDLARLRLNVCLNVLEPVLDPQGVRVDLRREWLTWAPLSGGFHEPEAFGSLRLTGLAGMVVRPPFLPALTGRPSVSRYAADDGGLRYTVAVDVSNHSAVSGTVCVTVLDRPQSGDVNRIVQPVELAASARLRLEIAVPVSNPASRSVEVLLEDPATGEVRQRDAVADTSVLTLLTVYPERNYFTDEREVAVMCELGLPAAAMGNLRAELKDGAGAVLAVVETVAPLTRLAAARARLADGRHNLRVEVGRKDGVVLFAREAAIVCRAPQPGREVKIDHVNRVVLRNGAPFFPFGLVFSATNQADFREVAAAGHNTLMWWRKVAPEQAPAWMAMAGEHKLLMWVPVENFCEKIPLTRIKVALIQGGKPPYPWYIKDFIAAAPDDRRALSEFSPGEKSAIFAAAYARALPEMLAGVRGVKDCENLLAYNNFDEAFGARYFDQWVQGLDLQTQVHAADGYHPMYALAGAEEFDFSDLIGPDPYWIPGLAGEGGNPLHVVNMHYMFEQRARPGRKPVVHVPVGERWSGMHQRYLVPAEQFCQTYLLLIHGAKGLFYFCYPFAHQSSFASLAELARQMQILGPAAVAPEVPQTVEYQPGVMDYASQKYPDIHARLFFHPADGLILLAANCRNYPVDAEFSLSCLEADGQVARLFAPDKFPVRSGRFKDRLEAYGVRAYRIPATRHPPVAIRVAMTGHPESPDPVLAAPAIPRSGREDRKNILPNPSFEQATLPGLPDYYRPTYMPGPRIGQEGALWGLDQENPWHGRVSMRLADWGFLECYVAPRVQKPSPMIFSAYLRAGRDGVEAVFNPGSLGAECKFKLTTGWRRYTARLAAAPTADRLSQYNAFRIHVPRGETIWLDGLQLECGETPTEFED